MSTTMNPPGVNHVSSQNYTTQISTTKTIVSAAGIQTTMEYSANGKETQHKTKT